MRPTSTTLSLLAIVALAAPAVAQGPASRAAAASAATQALPLAEPPAAKIVPASAGGPVSTAERLLADEDLLAASADVPDEPAVAEEIDKESAELEDLRRAEEASHVQEKSTVPPHQPGVGRIALLPELDHDLAQLQAEYDIPIEVNEAVVGYIRFFQSRVARGHFVKWLGRSHRYIDRYRAILKEEGIPQDTVFLAMIESGFGNFAYSRARASGPWQFIGPTGKMFGLKQDFWVDERRDPEKSAHAAARYLKQLHDQTGDWRLAWAGYNAGVGRIFKAKAKGYDDFWEMAAVPGRKVLRTETKGYVPKLMAAAIVTKHPEAFGFRAEEIDPQRWEEYAEVTIPSAALLGVVARAAGVTERALMDLNPELRRACTPPRAYQLTISSVAHHYGVPAEGIMEMNGLRTAKKLRVGQELIIPKPMGGGQLAAAAEPPPQARSRSPKARQGQVADEQPRREPAATQVAAAERVERAPRSTLRVQAGDTLWSISRRLGVELQQLCRWNGIDNPRRHKLLVGAQLVVFGNRG